jgi:hypothetical protein
LFVTSLRGYWTFVLQPHIKTPKQTKGLYFSPESIPSHVKPCKLKKTRNLWSIFWFYFKIFKFKSIDRGNPLFNWKSRKFRTVVSYLTKFYDNITYFLFYSKIFEPKSIDRRNTFFHWQSCQFRILVSCRTITEISWQMMTDLISDFISRTLNDNQLTGEIPSSIGSLVNLQEL